MLTLSYFDRDTGKIVTIEAKTDCVSVKVPEQEGQEALVVNVNTDAVRVDRATGEKSQVSLHQFTDLLADANADR